MDLGSLQELVSGGDFIARLVNAVRVLVFVVLPWGGLACFLGVVFGGDKGIAFVMKIREIVKGAKAVSAENNARLDSLEKKVDSLASDLGKLVEILKPKV